ncbi:hypothetical protein ACSBR1_025821 [Camellia fascicularis]
MRLVALDITADIESKEIYPPGLKLELLPLRVRPFDLVAYHPRTHAMAPGGMLRFEDFARGMPKDFLLRERSSHISHDATEELPAQVHELVDKASFSLFSSRLVQLMACRALLGSLVERWQDTTNSFYFSSTREMAMTPYDFLMIIVLRVRGDLIPFDLDMGQWEAAWIHLLGACPYLDRPAIVRYSWFYEHFHESHPKTQKLVKQYTKGFLIYLISSTLFANRWNTVGLYVLSALVVLPQVQFYN